MFDKLKSKIAKGIIKRKARKKGTDVKEFNNFVSKANSFLFVMPEENELFLEALEVAHYFQIHRKYCTLLLNEINVNRNEVEDYEIFPYSLEDAGKFGLPKKELLNKFLSKNFDVLIDLTFEKDVFLLALVALVNADFKISFQGSEAEEFSNLILPGDLKNPEISYRNLLNSLQMF